MKIKELIEKSNQTLEKVKSLSTKTATNTEKYYWEVKQMRESVEELMAIFKEFTEVLTAIIKEQMGD